MFHLGSIPGVSSDPEIEIKMDIPAVLVLVVVCGAHALLSRIVGSLEVGIGRRMIGINLKVKVPRRQLLFDVSVFCPNVLLQPFSGLVV